MALDSTWSVARFDTGWRFFWVDVVREADLERHGFTQPDLLSKGPRKDAESKNTGFPSRKC
jgi:hypothetical protein